MKAKVSFVQHISKSMRQMTLFVLLCSFFVYAWSVAEVRASEKIAESKVKISYNYAVKEELNSTLQEQIIFKDLSQTEKAEKDAAYTLVYQAVKEQNAAEQAQTHFWLWLLFLLLAIVSLFALYWLWLKKKRTQTMLLFFVLMLASVFFSHQVMASAGVLASYAKVHDVNVGEALPAPEKIENYVYLGYLKQGQSETATASSVSIPQTSESMALTQESSEASKSSTAAEPSVKLPATLTSKTPVSNASVSNAPSKVSQAQAPKTTTPVTETPQKEEDIWFWLSEGDEKKELFLTTVKEEKEILLPYQALEVEYRTDADLEQGQRREVLGQNGKILVEYEVSYFQGKEIARKEISRKTTPAVPTVIYVGSKQPGNPEQPSNPQQPTNPEQPTNPQQPSNPQQPTNPEQPSNPEQPTNPQQPSNPEQPTNPQQPSNPEQPSNPQQPTNPEQPTAPTEEKRLREELVPVAYLTENREDPQLAVGTTREEAGEEGQIKKIYEDTYVNGQLQSSRFLREEIVKNPKNKIIYTGSKQKAKPVVTIASVTKNPTQKQIVVNYTLVDTDAAYVQAKARIYNGDTLVKELDLPRLSTAEEEENFLIDGLALDTEYTLKTYLVYNRGTAEESAIEESTYDFILEQKSVEFKRITEISLYKDGEKVLAVGQKPTDFSPYYAKISTETMRDVYLQVKNMEEATLNGKPVYKVILTSPQLVQDRENGYGDDHIFYVRKTVAPAGTYGDFSELIAAIRANPDGDYVLGADMFASDSDLKIESNGVLTQQKYYFDGNFTGTLTGQNGNDKFAIYGLKAPLFKEMTDAAVRNIDFKEVNIVSDVENIGTVAGVLTRTTLEDVAVQGSLTGPANIGGVVSRVTTNSVLNNVAFEGNIILNANKAGYTGGIAGAVNSNSLIKKAYAKVEMKGHLTDGDRRMAGLIGGLVAGARLEEAYVKGNIVNTGNDRAQVGAITGSLWRNGIVNEVVSFAKVEKGQKIHGDKGDVNANVRNAYLVEGVSEGTPDTLARAPQTLTAAEATAKIQSYAITASTEDTSFEIPLEETDYRQTEGYQASREQVYRNIEKLLPYYTKNIIVKYGNKVAETDKLYTKVLQSTVLTQNGRPIYNLSENKTQANEVLLVYTDGEVERKAVTYVEAFKDTLIQEYKITEGELLYTPQTLAKEYASEIDALAAEWASLNYMDIVKELRPNYQYYHYQKASQALALGLDKPNSTPSLEVANQSLRDANVDPYYLKHAFDANKAEIKKHIVALLENDNVVDKTNKVNPTQRLAYLRENKAAILFGLAYITRWYSVDMGGINLADYTLYHQAMFGSKQSPMEFLKELGATPLPSDINNDLLMSNNTDKNYKYALAKNTGKATLREYLEYYKNLFVPNKTMNEWFKTSTKALIHEERPTMQELQHLDVSIWAALDRNDKMRQMTLPLLTMRHTGLGLSLTMNSLIMTSFERYFKTPAEGHFDNASEIKEQMQKMISDSARNLTLNAEFWYRILPESHKAKMYNLNHMPILSFDSFNVMLPGEQKGTGWMLNLQEGEAPKTADKPVYAGYAMKDFFAPIKEYRLSNGLPAYAQGGEIWFIDYQGLSKYGTVLMTHELVHCLDAEVYFTGFGRRDGMGPEDYATGMWQSVTNADSNEIGLILDADYAVLEDGKHLPKLINNRTPERIQSAQDLQSYFKRMFDVLYLLSYAEAEELLTLPKEDLRYLITKVEKIPDGSHFIEKFRAYTDEEWDAAQFRSLDDLIEQQAGLRKMNAARTEEIKRNSYAVVNRFYSHYGAYTTEQGGPGTYSFKLNSFELLAEGGYDAFLNYATNKLKSAAIAEGQVLSDAYILQKTFDGRYSSFNDFRKAMYAERYAKKDRIKPFVYKGVTYTSYADLRSLIAAALQKDLARAKNNNFAYGDLFNLKKAIYQHYFNVTNEFRSSIFEE